MPVPAPRPLLPSGLKLLNWFLAGWTALVFIFLYVPIAVLIVYSFNSSRLNIVWEEFTLAWYGKLLENKPLILAAKNSLVIAGASTVLSVILGTVGAWLLHRYRFRMARGIQTLVAIPMVMPEILMGISLLILFATAGMRLGFTTVIIVPSLRPAIIAGALMAFTLSMDELIVTFFIRSAASVTLPIQVYGLARVGLNPMLNALSAIFLLATVAFVLFSAYLKKLSHR
jgi:spermidine/putrescine transport system permease protein